MAVPFYRWPEQPREVVVEDGRGSSWCGKELRGSCPRPHAERQRAEFTVLEGLAAPEEVAEIIRVASASLAANIEKGGSRAADSVDNYPTFETYFLTYGSYHGGLEHVLRPFVETRLAPYVRERCGAPDATACTCLFRRYIPDERRIHPVHFDHQAFCTAVVGLNPEDFEGGLFVQGDLARGRQYVALGPGDVCVHQYDLHHGVDVRHGTRYSLIFWFMDTPRACLFNTRLWYRQAAEAGDADAQYNWAQCLFEGDGSGGPRDVPAALGWYRRSCDQNNVHALTAMGKMLWEGSAEPEVEADATRAAEYWRRAADLGFTKAMTNLGGVLLTGGGGWVHQDIEEGVRLLRRAADLDDVEAFFKLGYHGRCCGKPELVPYLRRAAERGHPHGCAMLAEMLLSGEMGLGRNEALAARFMRWAAHLGLASAVGGLGHMHLHGQGVPEDPLRAVELFERAFEQGDPGGTLNLALCRLRGVGAPADANEAMRLCRRAADAGHPMAAPLLPDFDRAVIAGTCKGADGWCEAAAAAVEAWEPVD